MSIENHSHAALLVSLHYLQPKTLDSSYRLLYNLHSRQATVIDILAPYMTDGSELSILRTRYSCMSHPIYSCGVCQGGLFLFTPFCCFPPLFCSWRSMMMWSLLCTNQLSDMANKAGIAHCYFVTCVTIWTATTIGSVSGCWDVRTSFLLSHCLPSWIAMIYYNHEGMFLFLRPFLVCFLMVCSIANFSEEEFVCAFVTEQHAFECQSICGLCGVWSLKSGQVHVKMSDLVDTQMLLASESAVSRGTPMMQGLALYQTCDGGSTCATCESCAGDLRRSIILSFAL